MRKHEFDYYWFKSVVVPLLEGYEINDRFFQKGDLGTLREIEFNNDIFGGVIHFWGQGFLEIYLLEFGTNDELINKLISVDEYQAKISAIKKLLLHLVDKKTYDRLFVK